jgi:hypothetical protein
LDLDAVYGGSYILARHYRLFTDGPMEGLLGDWASYILDENGGQKVLSDNGFLPLRESDRQASLQHVVRPADEKVVGYRVFREAANGTLDTFEVNGTDYNDATAEAGERYDYSVATIYLAGEGQRSEATTVTVPSSPGTAPPANGADHTILWIAGAGAALVVGALVVWSMRRRRG